MITIKMLMETIMYNVDSDFVTMYINLIEMAASEYKINLIEMAEYKIYTSSDFSDFHSYKFVILLFNGEYNLPLPFGEVMPQLCTIGIMEQPSVWTVKKCFYTEYCLFPV